MAVTMKLYLTVCCVILATLKITAGIVIPKFNFSIASLQNETGQWIAEVRLDHDEKQPWDVLVDHTTITHKGFKTIAIVATIIPIMAASPPPAGYERLIDGYYKIHKKYETWYDAMKSCENDGANLLILNSKEEALQMKNLMKKVGTEKYWHWIGVHDHFKEGQYLTVFGEPLESTGYSDWYQGQPDGGESQNCIYLQFSPKYNTYGLGDVDCNGKGPYICKKNIE